MPKPNDRLTAVLDEIYETDFPTPKDLERWIDACPQDADMIKETVATQIELYLSTDGFAGDRSPPTEAEVEVDFHRALIAQAEADRKVGVRKSRRRERTR